MIGTEKQVAYATKVQPATLKKITQIAADLKEAVEDGLRPEWESLRPILMELVELCDQLRAKVESKEDARVILDLKDAGLSNIMYKHGFYKRLPNDLTYVLGHIG